METWAQPTKGRSLAMSVKGRHDLIVHVYEHAQQYHSVHEAQTPCSTCIAKVSYEGIKTAFNSRLHPHFGVGGMIHNKLVKMCVCVCVFGKSS